MENEHDDLQLIRSINDEDNERAKEILFKRYEGMMHGLAHKYHSPLLPHSDAYQIAALGMMKAVRRFDHKKGISFKAFAYPNVEGELKKYYRDKAETVRLPRRLQKLKRRIILSKESFMKSMGREPTIAELASILAEDEEEVVEALAALNDLSPLSLDGPLASGKEQDLLAEGIGMEDTSFEEVEIDIMLLEALKNMPPRLQRIAELRLKKGLTQKSIAQELSISQMHVSRLQGEAMRMLGELCFAESATA